MAPATTGKHRGLVFVRQAKHIGELRFIGWQGDQNRAHSINRIRGHGSSIGQERLGPDYGL
jgi:hypothetical protein